MLSLFTSSVIALLVIVLVKRSLQRMMTRLLSLCGVANAINCDVKYSPLLPTEQDENPGCLRRTLFNNKISRTVGIEPHKNDTALRVDANDSMTTPCVTSCGDEVASCEEIGTVSIITSCPNEIDDNHTEGWIVEIDGEEESCDGDCEGTTSSDTEDDMCEEHSDSSLHTLKKLQEEIVHHSCLTNKNNYAEKFASRRKRSYVKLVNDSIPQLENSHQCQVNKSHQNKTQKNIPEQVMKMDNSHLSADNHLSGIDNIRQSTKHVGEQENSYYLVSYQPYHERQQIIDHRSTACAIEAVYNSVACDGASHGTTNCVCRSEADVEMLYLLNENCNMNNSRSKVAMNIHTRKHDDVYDRNVVTSQPMPNNTHCNPETHFARNYGGKTNSHPTNLEWSNKPPSNDWVYSTDFANCNTFQTFDAINKDVLSSYCVEARNPMLMEHVVGRPRSLFTEKQDFDKCQTRKSLSVRASTTSSSSGYSDTMDVPYQVKRRENSKEIRERRGYNSSWYDSKKATSHGDMNGDLLTEKLRSTNELKEKLQISTRRQSPSAISLNSYHRADSFVNDNSPRHIANLQKRHNKSQSCIISSGLSEPSVKPQRRVSDHQFPRISANSRVSSEETFYQSEIRDRHFSEIPNRVGSCMFTETMEEDFTPYMPSNYLPSPSKSSPSETPHRSLYTSVGFPARRSFSTASLYKSPPSRMKENLQPSVSLANGLHYNFSNVNNTNNAEVKFKTNRSFRKVLRRASSVNKDLRRRIKSWSPFSTKFDGQVKSNSNFYSTLNDDLIKEEPDENSPVKLNFSQDVRHQISNLLTNSKEQKNIYNAEIEKKYRYNSNSNFERCLNELEDELGIHSRTEIGPANNNSNSSKCSDHGWGRRRALRRERDLKSVSLYGYPDYIRTLDAPPET